MRARRILYTDEHRPTEEEVTRMAEFILGEIPSRPLRAVRDDA